MNRPPGSDGPDQADRGLSDRWCGVPLREWILLGLLTAAVLAAWYLWGTSRTGIFKDDTVHYARLAESLADPGRLPYTFRLLTPWLASRLPLDLASAFTIITLVSLWVTALLLNAFLAVQGLPPVGRWGGVLLFLGSGCVVRALTTPTYVDPLTYALTMAGFVALYRRHDVAFVAIAALGVLNRETALLLLPAYIVAHPPWRSREAALKALIVCGIPCLTLAAMVVLKLWAAGLLGQGLGVFETLRYTGAAQRVPRLGDILDAYSVFGVLWVVAALGVIRLPRELLPVAIHGALVMLQLTVSRGDESRNLSHLFPLILSLSAREIVTLTRVASASRLAALIVPAFLAAALMSMVHFRWTWISVDAARYVLVALGTGVAVALIAWARRANGGRETAA